MRHVCDVDAVTPCAATGYATIARTFPARHIPSGRNVCPLVNPFRERPMRNGRRTLQVKDLTAALAGLDPEREVFVDAFECFCSVDLIDTAYEGPDLDENDEAKPVVMLKTI